MAAPPAAPTTTAFIPPPPLPEWYLPKSMSKSDGVAASESQAIVKTQKEVIIKQPKQRSRTLCLEGDYTTDAKGELAVITKLPPICGDATDDRVSNMKARRVVTLAPPPPSAAVPPLAVYHICRICLRPRSTRYHREHPIPINGVPPPPGICRRCRVLKVEDEVVATRKVSKQTKEVDVVTQCESNEIKLGLAVIVPDEDYVTKEEMRQRRGRHLLRSVSRQRPREESESSEESEAEERKIVYRHVRIRETTQSPPSQRFSKVKTTVTSTAQDAIDSVSSRSQDAMMTTAAEGTTKMEVQVGSKQTASVSARGSKHIEATKAGSANVAATATASAYASSSSSRSPSKASARASATVVQQPRPERTESDIRRIAREEVERYRQAERKLEAHPDAFAHGRMVPVERQVPVERRIGRERDVVEVLPWRKQRDEELEVHVIKETSVAKPPPPRAERLDAKPVERQCASARTPNPPQSSRRSTQSQRNITDPESTAEPEPEPEPQQQQAHYDDYTGSGWSSTRTKAMSSTSNMKTTTVSMSRADSGRARDEEDSAMNADQEQLSDQPEYPGPRSTAKAPESSASEKTKWPGNRQLAKANRASESNPPDSVRLCEVVGWPGAYEQVRFERGSGQRMTEVWLPPDKYNVIEVIEEVELPSQWEPRSKVSAEDKLPARVRELKKQYDREEAQALSPTKSAVASVRSSGQTDRDYWVNGDVVRTASDHSAKNREQEIRYRTEEQYSEPPRGPGSLSERTHISEQASRVPSHRSKVETPTKNVRPESRSERSRQSARPCEYVYTKRIVRPADFTQDDKAIDATPDEYHRETEEVCRYVRRGEVRAEPKAKAAGGQDRREERRQKAKDGDSEATSHVRFSNKVEISPTPPGSDASSSQFRIIGGRGGKSRRDDGKEERGQDLIGEYERRGRARARKGGRGTEVRDLYYERESIRGGGEAFSIAGSGKSGYGESNDAAYRPRKSKPLTRALSESPSRERLSQICEAHEEEKVNGAGPYRPEESRPESMDVLDGSGHSRA